MFIFVYMTKHYEQYLILNFLMSIFTLKEINKQRFLKRIRWCNNLYRISFDGEACLHLDYYTKFDRYYNVENAILLMFRFSDLHTFIN